MSTSWTTPDARRTAAAPPAFGTSYAVPAQPVEQAPGLLLEAAAGLLAAVVTVLVGAPLGLLWAAVAPRAQVVVDGESVSLVRPASSDFIAGDGCFLLAVLLAGVVGGVIAWRLGREHGLGVVVGLAVGGALAAYVAMVVGQQVGLAEVQAAVQSGRTEPIELSLRLRAKEAVVGWPVGGLLGYVGASLVRGR